ncbi:hypothetical protein CRG98_045215 [Punica granatum]|uniref:Secreted protein n=1 Tax=Punica granatum TaxID=22663 RepID=A0A2I0HRR7_PUNGR|nr:hypothetical protein CRG98_045215 [Punica granatum]
MSSERLSGTCFLVLVTLRCVQTCFRVSFIGSWIGNLGSPVRKTSANVRECPGLSKRLLKCARGCHWSLSYQKGFLMSHIGHLLTLCSCLRVRMSVYVDPSFSRVFSVGASGPKWGADNLPVFGCVLG